LLFSVLLRLSCSDPLADGGAPKSDEPHIRELRRITLPRTPLNKAIGFGFIADSSLPP
jgi:hypothetical protein